MRFKLFRIFNIFTWQSLIKLALIVSFFIIFFIDLGIISILIALIAAILFLIFEPLNYPKSITIYDNQICYTKPQYVSSRHGIGFSITMVRFRVSNITRFKIKQTFFERIFGIAHIKFSGNTAAETKKHTSRVSVPHEHRIYGLRVKKDKSIFDAFASSTQDSQ